MATPTNLPASFVSGEILTAANMNLIRGGFRILQVVQGSTTTSTSVAGTTFVTSTLTANITCQSNTSKVLIVSNLQAFVPAANEVLGTRIVKTVAAVDTVLLTNAGALSSGGGSAQTLITQIFLDSPATVAALTYKVEIQRASGSGTLFAQLSSNPSTITLMEISA